MANVNDCLVQLQKLTQKNLEILQAINDSFLTNQNHLTVMIGDTPYAMPSFISLENKINSLQENFENLVNAPKTGEAYFNMNGNSRAIEVRGYTHTPNSIKLESDGKFKIDTNDILKDFLTPMPYVKFDLRTLPNDITSVNVKKIVLKNEELIQRMVGDSKEASKSIPYGDVLKMLNDKTENVDYIEYDTVRKLPIRKNIGSGSYVIEKILDDSIDVNLDNYITIKLSAEDDVKDAGHQTKLTYKRFDETLEKYLQVGDELVTYNDSAKMVITEIRANTNTIVVKVLNGEYLNLVEYKGGEIPELSIIKFFSPVDFDKDKYIEVPLEEDEYVYVAIAALNDRMNIQAPWGTGVLMDTSKYTLDGDDSKSFKDYYAESVRNVGDCLFEITSMMSNTLTKYSGEEFKKYIQAKPVIDRNLLLVTQINQHLNNSTTVKNIRSLYAQKMQYNNDLTEVQTKIDEINKQLAEISFDDTSNLRSSYTAQLTEYNQQKNELVAAMMKIVNEISLAVNNSDIPIENAKYHIRGFFDYNKFGNENKANGHINGIRVQYRYKNLDQSQGNALSIKDGNSTVFLYSDWNELPIILNPRLPKFDKGYIFEPKPDNSKENEPSFNQIDIPISQGEVVDIRLQVLYDFGYPFVETSSDWSDIVTIDFPKEYLKDVNILDIIHENNNDIESNRFKNIIREEGVPTHIGDKIIDQDITYFHKPESIASGFYTAERRIIPLKDKLVDIDAALVQLKDEILNTGSEAVDVNIAIGDVVNRLQPDQVNNISVEGYNTVKSQNSAEGIYVIDNNGTISVILNLTLINKTKHSTKLYSMFPGSRDVEIANLINTKYKKADYAVDKEGIYYMYGKDSKGIQTGNQFITFRMNSPYDGTTYYEPGAPLTSNLLDSSNIQQLSGKDGATAYIKLKEKNSLCLNSDSTRAYMVLDPGESVVIPIVFEYKLSGNLKEISKTMSFDLRTSLFEDPINYTFRINAKLESSTQDKLITTNRKFNNAVTYKTTVIK